MWGHDHDVLEETSRARKERDKPRPYSLPKHPPTGRPGDEAILIVFLDVLQAFLPGDALE